MRLWIASSFLFLSSYFYDQNSIWSGEQNVDEKVKEYFDDHGDQWDDLSSKYFTEKVRDAAIRKAFLRPEFVVADIGSGTGFLSAGLAPLVRRVYAVDRSSAMLEIAQKKLAGISNIEYLLDDGVEVNLPDESLDAVFANMVLHHCQDPLAAITEMSRLLRPGGRLIITDLDVHPYSWLKTEMVDIWQGFGREQIRAWFRAAGLVNLIVDCSGEECLTESTDLEDVDVKDRSARISVFVAVGTHRLSGVKSAVQDRYSWIAESGSSCCSSENSAGCCDDPGGGSLINPTEIGGQSPMAGDSVNSSSLLVETGALSLGCGNPVALAGLQPGEVVLDIGSGSGWDAALAARRVGPTGRVIGVDMTPAMLSRARWAIQKIGLENVEFRLGRAESLPLEAGLVDVVLSNCVINLSEDKGQVFKEVHRVLRAGGRLEISDMVTDRSFPAELASNPAHWAGCVYGALPQEEYLDLISQAGFSEISIRQRQFAGNYGDVALYSLTVSARKKCAPLN